MNEKQLDKIKNGKGFIAALDQSGGSTPKALTAYGIKEADYANEEEMFDLVHDMRTRIITSPAFDGEFILGAILFEQTMDRKIESKYTADYLAENKNVVPFLKIDKGLAEEKDGIQLMKPIPNLEDILKRANERHIFGTKMRSVIKEANNDGIKEIIDQQFTVGKQIIEADLMPIIEPEVDIHSGDKEAIEDALKWEILAQLDQLADDEKVMLKLTIPTQENAFKELIDHPNVIRVVALSGGYTQADANEQLKENDDLIASFSRALTQDLNVDQSDEEFHATLNNAVQAIYNASL